MAHIGLFLEGRCRIPISAICVLLTVLVRSRHVVFMVIYVRPLSAGVDGRLTENVFLKTLSTSNLVVNMLNKYRVKTVFLLKLLSQLIIVIILVQENAVNLIIIYFYLDDG